MHDISFQQEKVQTIVLPRQSFFAVLLVSFLLLDLFLLTIDLLVWLQGQVPLVSVEALHQLHIFIFVLAVFHVIFCASTMVLGGARVIPLAFIAFCSSYQTTLNPFISKAGSD